VNLLGEFQVVVRVDEEAPEFRPESSPELIY
jgi:hypothetical protein